VRRARHWRRRRLLWRQRRASRPHRRVLPRAVLFVLEPGMIGAVCASSLGCLFRPDILVRKTGPKTTTKELRTNSSDQKN
jgi:hypothetical protein